MGSSALGTRSSFVVQPRMLWMMLERVLLSDWASSIIFSAGKKKTYRLPASR